MGMAMEFETREITVGPTTAHMWHGGDGFPLLLMHGAGPGTSAAANFGRVRDALAARHHIYATDMIGFGKSGRKAEPPYFDYPLWVEQMQAVLDEIPEGPIGLIGHSISATFAIRLAAANERVQKVLLSCPMGRPLVANAGLEQLWTFPDTREDLRRSLEVLFYDHSVITEDLLTSRMAVLAEPGYGDYFRKVFGGDKQALVDQTVVDDDTIRRVSCPVAIIHGRNDTAFPIEETAYPLAGLLPHADVHALARCSHGPAFERSETFLNIAFDFFG
jgi:2-hydroxymuconate-semialdehyde hydrolase